MDQVFFRRAVTIMPRPPDVGIEEFIPGFVAHIRRFLLDGKIDCGWLKKRSSTAAARIVNDSLLGNVIFVIRALKGVDATVIIMYQINGSVTHDEVQHIAAILAQMPQQPSWKQLVGNISETRPSPALALPAIKQALSAAVDRGKKPNVAKQLLKQLNDDLENFDDIARHIQICLHMHFMLGHPSLADFLDSKTLNEMIAVFECTIFLLISISDFATAAYLTSIFARALASHPCAEAATIYRSIRMSQSLTLMTSEVRKARWRESLTTFLLGLSRLSSFDREIDPYKEISFAATRLDGRQNDLKRVLVNFLGSISMLTGTNRYRERLARTDIAQHMIQTVRGDDTVMSELVANIEAHKAKRGGRRHRTHGDGGILDRATAEFEPDEAVDTEQWIDEVSFFDLYHLVTKSAIKQQALVYGIEEQEEGRIRTKIRAFVKKNSPRQGQDQLLFIRGFRASRRIWIPNLFEFTSTDVIPFDIEPVELLIEAALYKGLGVLFECYAMGGLYEMFGMGRWHLPFTRNPDTQWREALKIRLNDVPYPPRFILVLPDVTTGLTWEINQLIDQGHLSKTVIVMIPEAFDQTASSSWDVLAGVFRERGLSIEKYSTAGGFVALDASGQTRKRCPFESLFSGELARELYKQAAASRSTRARSR